MDILGKLLEIDRTARDYIYIVELEDGVTIKCKQELALYNRLDFVPEEGEEYLFEEIRNNWLIKQIDVSGIDIVTHVGTVVTPSYGNTIDGVLRGLIGKYINITEYKEVSRVEVVSIYPYYNDYDSFILMYVEGTHEEMLHLEDVIKDNRFLSSRKTVLKYSGV